MCVSAEQNGILWSYVGCIHICRMYVVLRIVCITSLQVRFLFCAALTSNFIELNFIEVDSNKSFIVLVTRTRARTRTWSNSNSNRIQIEFKSNSNLFLSISIIIIDWLWLVLPPLQSPRVLIDILVSNNINNINNNISITSTTDLNSHTSLAVLSFWLIAFYNSSILVWFDSSIVTNLHQIK